MAQPDHHTRTRPQAQASSLLDRVIRGQSSYVRRAAFISVITSLLAVTPTLYMMVVYNRVVTSRNETTLLMFLLCAIGVYALMEILELVRTRLLQIAGVIRPQDIRSDNQIPYDRIAEARIAYGGRGQMTDFQQPRWGQQVFDILFPF